MRRSMAIAACLAAVLTGAAQAQAKLGEKAPDFTLPDLDGKDFALAKLLEEKPVVIMFWCPTCPTVRHLESELNEFAKANAETIHFLAIASNEEDSVASLKPRVQRAGYPFPVLRDEGNAVADDYGARVTPHAYLIDKKGVLRYAGSVVGKDGEATLQPFVDALLAEKELPSITRTHREFG